MNMKTFESFFTDEAVVRALIGIRMKTAVKRHDLHFFRNMSLDSRDPRELTSDVDQLLPPRSQWLRPRADVRKRLGTEVVTRLSISNAALKGLRTPSCSQPWAGKLRKFIDDIRARAANPSAHPLRQPDVFAIKKEKKGKEEQPGYRVLTQFAHLPDRILIGQTAKYLMNVMDGLFLNCSHAFRGSKSGCARDTAVRRIQEYINARQGVSVYTSECDIRKFFDYSDHEIARSAFDSAVANLSRQETQVHESAKAIFNMYLDLYDYLSTGWPVVKRAMEDDGSDTMTTAGEEASLMRELRAGKAPGRVGIPQGGALSPLIANLVMDAADQAVLGTTQDPELLYLRYCDDMIVLHTDRSRCREALNRYTASVRELLLPIHSPAVVTRYSREFHESKSKEPYRVGETTKGKSAVPWISFLGYQVHWDGAIRVRKDSLDRHKRTQSQLVRKVLSLVRQPRAGIRLTGRQIEWRTALRLVSVAIGRTSLSGAMAGRQPCWMNAFSRLDRNPHSETQMRQLDRNRDHFLRKLRRAVNGLTIANIVLRRKESKANTSKKRGVCAQTPFVGRPLSYCGRLIGDKPLGIQFRAAAESGTYGREF